MAEPSETAATHPDRDAGTARPEALEALSAGIDRGHHLALVAAEGAGLGALYAAAAAHDLEDAPEARAVVLVATEERARRLARTIHAAVRGAGLETVAWSGRSVAPGRVVIGTPATLLADVRAARLPLSDVRLLVLDDVRALAPEGTAVEALLQLAGEETRLVAVTHARDRAFDDLVTRRLPRARRWPAELFEGGDGGAPSGAPLLVGTAATLEARVARAVELLHELAEGGRVDRVVVWCADPATLPAVEAALAVEGFEVDGGDAGVGVALLGSDVAGEESVAVLLEAPVRADALRDAVGPVGRRSAIVPPRHARHLELLAERLGWPHRPLGDHPTAHVAEIERFRALVEDGVARLDLAAAALLIEPLVERLGYHAVAAALAGLLRETGRLAERAPGAGAAPDAPRSTDAERAARPAWTRVFVNVGKQDGASPGDFVGAITGETSAAAAQIGKIEVRPRFTLIDIDSMIVDDVIRGLSRARIKGRDVAARLDRGG